MNLGSGNFVHIYCLQGKVHETNENTNTQNKKGENKPKNVQELKILVEKKKTELELKKQHLNKLRAQTEDVKTKKVQKQLSITLEALTEHRHLQCLKLL